MRDDVHVALIWIWRNYGGMLWSLGQMHTVNSLIDNAHLECHDRMPSDDTLQMSSKVLSSMRG